ncbi:hypothetical protein ERO13_D05G318432v2 [Gossypium hirsutum]|uniref:Transmembrane protein n=3 Tax=Gossypium TaxID=3633 RepID=A0A5J5RKK4_GOSBA|nr:hypothetical protein ES319_D05G340300v1 [Gossypium barbadense]KAG4149023.1 hypothetical protein ERO13_D05G318432v2 [Gossypium hirsutum]TYH73891.1 hypothetical protein ES332_D05G360200v1 [Gossypium tomentosum]TYI84192.1 hypothetical protein E1A91_D05G347400v1 [Gossypium mustelinum]
MAPLDPHSFTDSHHTLTTDISLFLFLDFPSATIYGVAFFILKSPHVVWVFLKERRGIEKLECWRLRWSKNLLVKLFNDKQRGSTTLSHKRNFGKGKEGTIFEWGASFI